MNVFRLTKSWEETEVTWRRAKVGDWWTSYAGAQFESVGTNGNAWVDPYATSTENPTDDDQPIAWDITDLVSEWYSGSHANNGLMLTSEFGNHAVFLSRELGGASLGPRLEVTFSDPAPIPEPSSLIVWSLIGLTFAGTGWRRRRKAA